MKRSLQATLHQINNNINQRSTHLPIQNRRESMFWVNPRHRSCLGGWLKCWKRRGTWRRSRRRLSRRRRLRNFSQTRTTYTRCSSAREVISHPATISFQVKTKRNSNSKSRSSSNSKEPAPKTQEQALRRRAEADRVMLQSCHTRTVVRGRQRMRFQGIFKES